MSNLLATISKKTFKTSNPIATITNTLSQDIEIYDVYDKSEGTAGVYTYTMLGEIKAGETGEIQTIHFASQLQAMYTGTVTNLNEQYLYQFPIAVFAVSELFDTTTFSITNDDQTGMEQAYRFSKYAQANAGSKITKDFVTALSDKNDQEAAVNKFFKGTASFNKCDLTKWTAITSWLNQFTSPWQGPYYLYNNTGTIKLIGIVQIKSDAKTNTANLGVANIYGKVTTDSELINLQMSKGTITEDTPGSGPSVSLKPVWLNVVQTTEEGDVNYVIGSALSGTFAGQEVTGTQTSRNLTKAKSEGLTEKEKEAAEKAKNEAYDRAFSHITNIIGLVLSMGMLAVMVKEMKSKNTQKNNDAQKPGETESDAEQAQAENDESYHQDIQNDFAPEATSTLVEVEGLGSDYREIGDIQKVNNLNNTLSEQKNQLQEVLEEEPPTVTLEDTAQDLLNIQNDIKDIDPSDPADEAKIAKANKDLDTVQENVSSELEKSGEHMQQYEKDSLKQVDEAIKEKTSQDEQIEQAQEEQAQEETQGSDEPVDDSSFDPADTDPCADFPVGE